MCAADPVVLTLILFTADTVTWAPLAAALTVNWAVDIMTDASISVFEAAAAVVGWLEHTNILVQFSLI
jgi:hypothetical protein